MSICSIGLNPSSCFVYVPLSVAKTPIIVEWMFFFYAAASIAVVVVIVVVLCTSFGCLTFLALYVSILHCMSWMRRCNNKSIFCIHTVKCVVSVKRLCWVETGTHRNDIYDYDDNLYNDIEWTDKIFVRFFFLLFRLIVKFTRSIHKSM